MRRITLPPEPSPLLRFSRRVNDFVLLGTIVALGVFCILAAVAIHEHERQLAIEARV